MVLKEWSIFPNRYRDQEKKQRTKTKNVAKNIKSNHFTGSNREKIDILVAQKLFCIFRCTNKIFANLSTHLIKIKAFLFALKDCHICIQKIQFY